MHNNHMNVDEAIEAFNDLNARHMIPQQWGTFHLGDQPPGYSILELKRKIAERRLDASRFIIIDIGAILPIQNQLSTILITSNRLFTIHTLRRPRKIVNGLHSGENHPR